MLAALDEIGLDTEQTQQPATDPPIRSRSAVASAITAGSGAANERRIESGRPASEPGV